MRMKIELDYLHRDLMEQIEELEATVSELEESIEAKDDRILELEAELEAVDRVKQEFYYRVVTVQLDTPEEFLRLEGWYTAP